MKKLLSLATMLGVLSGAAAAAPYVMPSHQPGALTPYDIQPVYSIEGLYAIPDNSDDPDTAGVRLSFNLYNNAEDTLRHQFKLSVSPQWGSESYSDGSSVDLFMAPVTVGYEMNIELTDSTLVYLGAKVGYAWGKIEDEWTSESTGGFHYSVGGGLKFMCSDTVYVNVGYEYGRTYFSEGDVEYNMGQHIISAGVGCQF
jgi:opacity protein-like surface antigen